MKKLIAILVVLTFGLAIKAYCVTQYQAIGNVSMSSSTVSGGLGIFQRSKAALLTLTPTTTGQIFYCNDCTSTRICVSTSSFQNSIVAVSSGALSACN